ncbi:hypothetical protein MA20_20365 [Bradyrhizobium japonicum]|uniref:Uncharacterized protein n=2 Tax=Bradyrhizobium TaxID=374 RepID=A0A0A3XXI3_BRAJP|nr:hypothetical protein RN69_38615 [Bradyrhizobium japonicum]APG15160.1 hypothetical protein BKD09_43345 [Bradyrhizobium japonicum]AWL91541.1 hypothetical protein CIT37_04170 [Bradyrhizobium ottawaense]KGT77989.1 hypothetical protein MA20_20365 [Bradyrhizobium japonicum]KMJ93514.1 hypothetical protein CF64_42685 [Bradyrhizobium japonicum]
MAIDRLGQFSSCLTEQEDFASGALFDRHPLARRAPWRTVAGALSMRYLLEADFIASLELTQRRISADVPVLALTFES